MNLPLLPRLSALACALVALPLHAADLLVAGFDGDVVVRYDGTTGAFVGAFASHATMDGPTALAYGPDGNLYVLNEFSHNVLRFDGATGVFIGEFISPSALGAVGLTDPDDLEIGPDGNFYITSHISTATAAIWKFSSATGAFLDEFGSLGAVHHTHGLTLGPDGNFYLGDLATATVEKFNGTSGVHLSPFASNPALDFTGDLAFAPDGKLYVTRDGPGGVTRYGSGGAPLGPLIPSGASSSYWGILFDAGSLYLGNKSTGTIKKYTDTGVFVSDFITGAPAPFDIAPMVPEPSLGALLAAGAMVFFRRGLARVLSVA